MLTSENFEEVINGLLSKNDKKKIIKSDKEFCILTMHIFNAGAILSVKFTNNFKECEFPETIVYTNDIKYKLI